MIGNSEFSITFFNKSCNYFESLYIDSQLFIKCDYQDKTPMFIDLFAESDFETAVTTIIYIIYINTHWNLPFQNQIILRYNQLQDRTMS